jgi:hypothetical protein
MVKANGCRERQSTSSSILPLKIKAIRKLGVRERYVTYKGSPVCLFACLFVCVKQFRKRLMFIFGGRGDRQVRMQNKVEHIDYRCYQPQGTP